MNRLESPDEQQNDARLAELLKRRDPNALAELYGRFGRLVYSVIFAIVRDRANIEDLVQDTFLRVWTRAQTFHSERGALNAWLLTIARNRAIDHVQSAGTRLTIDWVENREQPCMSTAIEKDLISADDVRHIRYALSHLSANQRTVIELAYFEELSQAEVAVKLGQPLGTVKTWTRMALKLMREEMGKQTVAHATDLQAPTPKPHQRIMCLNDRV